MKTNLIVVAILFQVFIPLTASAVMCGFLDANGVFHYRDVSEKSLGALFTGGAMPRHAVEAGHNYESYIREAAAQCRLDPLLVRAVIEVESNFNPNAVSDKGAEGLMQIMPATARDFHLSDPFDPKQNIIAGTRYLKRQLINFGDIRLALAAYNAGPALVSPRGMLEYIPATQAYVARVLSAYHRLAINLNKRKK
jgi:soluble lytic murein transglycosylase-like protein